MHISLGAWRFRQLAVTHLLRYNYKRSFSVLICLTVVMLSSFRTKKILQIVISIENSTAEILFVPVHRMSCDPHWQQKISHIVLRTSRSQTWSFLRTSPPWSLRWLSVTKTDGRKFVISHLTNFTWSCEFLVMLSRLTNLLMWFISNWSSD